MAPMIAARPTNTSLPVAIDNDIRTKPTHTGPSIVSTNSYSTSVTKDKDDSLLAKEKVHSESFPETNFLKAAPVTNSQPDPVNEFKMTDDNPSSASTTNVSTTVPVNYTAAAVASPEVVPTSPTAAVKDPAIKNGVNVMMNGNGAPHNDVSANGGGLQSAKATGSLLIQPTSVSKVIKGEVHNVLNVMRTDPRYVSPLRFMEELPTDEQHPLLLQLRDLHHTLSEWEITQADKQPLASLYLTPFCDAIKGRDISAPVTGAALHAIHKFVLYGFLASQSEAYRTIANTLLLCTFEESGGTTDAEGRRRFPADKIATNNHEDEQVVLKLLDLSALVVRCASQQLEPEIIVGLLDTCLHVSHRAKRASALLKSAASDALGQIVLEVFSHPHLSKAREAILAKLASLLNPQKNSDAYVVNSLMLVNIALETLITDDLTENEISILQNDLCKFLLGWSTTHDLVILSLTMRVIFNLFQTISNHLKVPLEVFLTSVHLRILEHSTSNEEREVALESLLEFCQEPALMKDLYLNYDCDVNCTNLYAHICTTLGDIASPSVYPGHGPNGNNIAVEMDKTLEGSSTHNSSSRSLSTALNGDADSSHAPSIRQVTETSPGAAEVPMNALNVLAVEGLLTIVESIARRVKASSKDKSLDRTLNSHHSSSGHMDVVGDLMTEQMTEEEFQENKKQKLALSKLAEIFNSHPKDDNGWIHRGKDLGIPLESPENVAEALFQAPGLDKAKLGEYLGKGPAQDYPFEDSVRRAFVSHFDFSKDKNFASALRIFLQKFRLPGEAQCIDRFMEAFAQEYFKQQKDSTALKSKDATYVLAFSTIILNTDLHNPMNKNPRMTCEQFIANNRGTNDGEDLPYDLLTELYDQIKETEIQVQRDLGEFISLPGGSYAEHFRAAWGELLSKQVAAASFTPAEEAIKTINQVGVHEKDMFLVIAKPALKGIASAFVRSWDDGCILYCLKGLEQMARIATYFGLDSILNEIMSFLLTQGREFVAGCISLEFAGIDSGAPIAQSATEDDETMSIVDPDSPIPQQLLRVHEFENVDTKRIDISGSAAYRGLLALNMGLKIVRTLFSKIRSAWPHLIEVICCLRDARALPPGLADLDDFADSNGNVLPLSTFARKSQQKLDDHYRGINDKEPSKRGWFKMPFFGKKGRGEQGSPQMRPEISRREMTANQKTLLQVAQRVGVDKIVVFGNNVQLPIVKNCVRALLASVDKFPDGGSPTFEQHQAFALELAARTLLANRERAVDLLPLFLPKFESVVNKVRKMEGRDVPYPFLVERVVVTILRTSIHLYQVQAVSSVLRKFISA